MPRYSAAIALLLVSACDKHDTTSAPPVQQVGVVTLAPSAVPITADLPGRVTPFLIAEVRARVDGIVLRRCFAEGSDVRQGQLLFQIDPAPYQAALDGAQAALQKARANLAAVQAQAARYKILVEANAVSRQDYANAVSSAGQAKADVAAAEAQVETARINLGYTAIRAPITGRIGFSNVTVGAYVQASAATLLATIQQVDPIYVDVTEPISDILTFEHDAESGKAKMASPDAVKATLRLDDGSLYPLSGRVLFSDITVNQGTGSVTLRAIYPNPHVNLLPGMFVHAELAEGVNENAILAPEPGVTHDPSGNPTALVVDANDKVELRSLVTSQTYGTNWLIDSGLSAGDRIIVQGLQFVHPGDTVKPVELDPAQSSAPGVDR